MFFNFQNTYAKLPQNFYQKIKPTEVSNPKLLYCNESLANSLGLEHKLHDEAEIAQIFSGNKILSNSDPIALAYAGHQFGYFVPQLGDGRAVLLGEIKDQANKRFDVQLKGSGVTAYSRNGDGRAALGPVLREYIISEAMHYLGVKTTRSLAVVSTGENVLRNGMLLPGAILTRIASSHIRIGTFEYFASRGDIKSLKILADYTIDRHYPELKTTSAPYVSLFEKVMEAQIELIVNWMRVGFIHGVMNTDNTSIAGETLDYGPCAFLDEYDPDKVFSAIDYQGRYSFSNQPQICYWNLAQLAQCIALVIGGDIEKSLSILYAVLANFKVQYQTKYYDMMCRKIGITTVCEDSISLVNELLNIMHQEQTDYTLTFRYLSYLILDKQFDYSEIYNASISMENWVGKWMIHLGQEKQSMKEHINALFTSNPAIIARNHMIDEAIKQAVEFEDFTKVDSLLKILSEPYNPKHENINCEYMREPSPAERVYKTFCGT